MSRAINQCDCGRMESSPTVEKKNNLYSDATDSGKMHYLHEDKRATVIICRLWYIYVHWTVGYALLAGRLISTQSVM